MTFTFTLFCSADSDLNIFFKKWKFILHFLRIKIEQLLDESLVLNTAAATAKSLQSCPTLCDPIDGSPPGSPVPGILQARIQEWVAISFSNA